MTKHVESRRSPLLPVLGSLRNPMYVALVTLVVGQALVLGSPPILLYAGAGAVIFLGFVLLYEEPVLRARFGKSYETYCAAVPRFLPRLSPWRPE